MKTLTNFKTWSTRAKNATAALLFLAAYTISMVSPFVTTKAYAAEVSTDTQATTQSDASNTTVDTPSGDETPSGPTDTTPSDITDAGDSTGTPPVGFAMLSQSYQDPGCYQYCNPKGSITIVKDAQPNSNQSFSFSTSGLDSNQPKNFSLKDSGVYPNTNQKSFTALDADKTYSFSETGVGDNGWVLDSIVCIGGHKSIISSNVPTASIKLSAGEDITCTFTNKAYGQLIVRKTTYPSGSSQIFDVSAKSSNGGVVFDSATSTVSDNKDATFKVQLDKSYSVTETVPDGWMQTSNNCVNKSVTNRSNNSGNIPTEYCDIVNTKLASLTIIKQTNPDGSQVPFSFTTSGQLSEAFQLSDGQSKTYNKLVPDALVKVSELPIQTGSWKLTSLSCDNNGVNTNLQSGYMSYTPKAGESVICTFTNTRQTGTVKVIKKVINDNGGQKTAAKDFSFRNNGGDEQKFSATDGANGQSILTLDIGSSFSIKEIQENKDGYDTTYSGCSGTVSLDIHTCTITNDDKPVTISGHKKIANTDMSWVTQGMNPVNGWTVYLDQNHNGKLDNNEKWTKTDANGYYSFTGLNSNTTYYVNEVITSLGNGWAQISAPSPVFVSFSGGVSTNNDFKNIAQGTITVIKNVDDGFGHVTKNVKTWTWSYDGKQQDGHHLATGSNNTQTVPSGTYKVSEDQKPGYHVVASNCNTNYNPYDQYSYNGDRHDGDNNNKVDEDQSVKVGLGQNVTCEFTNKRDTGTITVHKKIGDKVDPTGWTWWLGDSEGSNRMGDTEKVASGWYWFGENQQDGYSFDSLKCRDGRESVWVNQGVEAKIYVGKDAHIECTFTNSRDTGDVTIIKDAKPDSSQGFVFTIEPVTTTVDQGDESGYKSIIGKQDNSHSNWYQHDNYSSDSNPTTTFTLTDNGDSENSQTTSLPTGKYRVSEAAVDGWDLTGISCGETKVETDNGVLYLDVVKGVSVTCTFTNTKRAQLTIIKDVQPGVSSKAFSFTTNAVTGELGADTTFSLTDDGTGLTNSKSFENLLPGTYTVTEQSDSAWKLNDIVCSGPGVTMTREGAKLMVTLAAGAVVSCTFVNSFIPQVLAETTTLPTLENTGTSAVVTTIIALVTIATALWVTLYRRKASLEAVKITKY